MSDPTYLPLILTFHDVQILEPLSQVSLPVPPGVVVVCYQLGQRLWLLVSLVEQNLAQVNCGLCCLSVEDYRFN